MPQKDLIPKDRWTVVTSNHTTTLYYGGRIVDRGKGDLEQYRLRRVAELMNKHSRVPRRREECAADAANPTAYLRKLNKAQAKGANAS